jgi:hypothetical protein
LPKPIRFRIADTVDKGIANTSAISAAVMRSRRRSSTTRTRSAGVLLGMRRGRELRSSRPVRPSERKRASHFAAVRSLMPAACAAAAIVQPSSSTRSTISRRECRQVRALPWSFIWDLLWSWGH